jgi:hypothetical protein
VLFGLDSGPYLSVRGTVTHHPRGTRPDIASLGMQLCALGGDLLLELLQLEIGSHQSPPIVASGSQEA